MKNIDLLEKVGVKLRSLRQERGLNQEALAEMLKLSVSAYAKLERGETDITLSRIEQIASLFGLTALDIITNDKKEDFSFNNNQNNSHIYQGIFEKTPELEHLKKQIELLDMALQRLTNRMNVVEGKIKN